MGSHRMAFFPTPRDEPSTNPESQRAPSSTRHKRVLTALANPSNDQVSNLFRVGFLVQPEMQLSVGQRPTLRFQRAHEWSGGVGDITNTERIVVHRCHPLITIKSQGLGRV